MPFIWKRKNTNDPSSITTSRRSKDISDSSHRLESARNLPKKQHNDNTAAPSLSSCYVHDHDMCYNHGDDFLHTYSYRYQSVRAETETKVLRSWAEETHHFLDQNCPWAEQWAIYLIILSVATWFLGGRSSKRGRGKRKQQHRALEWQNRKFHLKRSVSTGRVSLEDNARAPATSVWDSTAVEKQESFSEQTSATTDDEEERFEQYYWEVICHSNYRRLVLPPQCRYVGRNDSSAATSAPARGFQMTTFNRHGTTTCSTTTLNQKESTTHPNNEDAAILPDAEDDDNEDNPVGRIQYYQQQLWSLIRSILSFDYTRVVWMLWTWAQSVRRRHLKQRSRALDDDDDDGGGVVGLNIVHDQNPAASALLVAIEGSNNAENELADILSTVDEEHEHSSFTTGDNDRVRNPSPVDMMIGDQIHKVDRDCDDKVALTEFVSPRQEQTPVPERKRLHNSVLPRAHAPMIPPITTKQLLLHGMLQQQHRPECAEASSNDSDMDKVPIPLLTPAESTTNTIAGMDHENSSSSKRFITNVVPKRSWLRKRSSPIRDLSDTDLCGLDDANEVVTELSEVDADYDQTTSDDPALSSSAFRQEALINISSAPTLSQAQGLLPQTAAALPPSLSQSATSGSPDPMALATTSKIHSSANVNHPLHQQVDHDSPTPTSSEPENVFPILRHHIHQTAASSKLSLHHFFDTASSRESLKKMSVEVTIPDKHGYILGDDFLSDGDRSTPLLVFVNSRSGPQQGHLLITQLRRLLNPIQVWDLSADGSPETVLESFLVLSRLRILVCGGDGTVSWIIHLLEKMQLLPKHWPPIAILPLGTGNDLGRVHGWGGGYNNSESLITILEQICESYASLLDRWEVTIHDRRSKNNKNDKVKGFINYLGVGADAQAALQVHYLRESRPQWFFSRLVNKAMYGIFGAEDILRASSVHVRKEIQLVADGVEIPLPPDSQGIILLNIDSYAGGVPLWTHGVKNVHHRPDRVPMSSAHARPRRTRSLSDFEVTLDRVDSSENLLRDMMTAEEKFAHVTACNLPSSCQDGYLDVVSIRGAFHLGQIKVGLSNAQRLCQCREATITIRNKVAVHVDGEPWRQRAATLTIRRKKEPAVMLHRSADDWGVEMEMSKLLDWAEERKMIDGQVHSILMKEFSRRIESKTRQRRVRAQDNIMSTLKKAMSSGAMAGTSASMNSNSNIMTNSSSNILWQGGAGDGILF